MMSERRSNWADPKLTAEATYSTLSTRLSYTALEIMVNDVRAVAIE